MSVKYDKILGKLREGDLSQTEADLLYASLTGYNNTDWDTAYGWGNHAGLYVPLAGGTLTDGAVVEFDDNGNTGLALSKYGVDLLNGTLTMGPNSEASMFYNGGNITTNIAGAGGFAPSKLIVGSSTGLLKGTSGVVGYATAGADYQSPLSADVDYLTPDTASATYLNLDDASATYGSLGSANSWTNNQTYTKNNLAVTNYDTPRNYDTDAAILLQNTTAATSTTMQYPPAIRYRGYSYASGASTVMDFISGFKTRADGANGFFYLAYRVGGSGTYTEFMKISTSGYFTSPYQHYSSNLGTIDPCFRSTTGSASVTYKRRYSGAIHLEPRGYYSAGGGGSMVMSIDLYGAVEEGVNNPTGMFKVACAVNAVTSNDANDLMRLEFGERWGAIFNENSINGYKFRVEGDSDADLINANTVADKVGIGTASPNEKLEVNGVVRATGFSAGVATGIDQAIEIYDGYNDITHYLTFTKGLLTEYSNI